MAEEGLIVPGVEDKSKAQTWGDGGREEKRVTGSNAPSGILYPSERADSRERWRTLISRQIQVYL